MLKKLVPNLRWNLSQVIWRGDALFIGVAFVLAAVISLPLAQRVAMNQSQELMETVAQRVSTAILSNDVQAVDSILKDLQKHQSVQSVELSNAQGASVVAYARVGQGFVLRNEQSFELASLEMDSYQKAYFSKPLIFDGHIVATLSLAVDLWPIYLKFISWGGGILMCIAAVSILLKQQNINIYFEKISFSTAAQSETDKNYLKNALDKQLRAAGIKAQYQPIVRLADGGVFGAELMVSWRHPSGQTLNISPADFVMLCHKSDLFLPVASWLLEKACTQVAKWQKQYGPLILSLNISRSQLKDKEFGNKVRAVCAQAGYPHQLLEFEVTESALAHQSLANTQELMQSFIKEQRLGLTLDSYGLLAQSAHVLNDLNVQKININSKLTKSFLNDSLVRDWVKELCEHALATDTQIRAEGIETQAQQDGLQALGCLFGQGPKFGHPMSARQFGDYLSSHFFSDKKPQIAEKMLVI